MRLQKIFETTAVTVASLATLSLVTACSGGGFQSLSSVANNATGNSGQSTNPTNPVSTPSAFQQMDYTGYVNSGIYDKTLAFDIDKVNNAFIINLPIPSGSSIQWSIMIPQLPGAQIKTYTNSAGQSNVAISIPLSYVLHGVSTLPATALPNGSPLPQMPSGELPSLGLSLNNSSDNKIYLYMGVNAVGMYIESSYIPPYIGMTFPVSNKAGTKTLAYLTLVPKAGNFNGGLFVGVTLPNDIAKIIDDHLSGIIN